ncbi:hypothetical protein NDA10_005767 [Ustilago hordei]|nr:hypothetical protein NDA10_005767 [Ustilago hordei]
MLLWLVLLAFCAALLPLIALLCLCIYISAYRSTSRTTRSQCLGRSAAVVVLGDIGRSPRMCFHVESLANEGWKVAIVGYPGSSLPPALHRPSIRQHHLRPPPSFISRLPRKLFILAAPVKLLIQSLSLFLELTMQVHPPPELVLVQTPPALPTLLVVKAAAALVKARVIIDWHNLAYTILALRLGEKSKVVRLAEKFERWSGRTAYAHLFVSEAMRNHLDLKWGLVGEKKVLHDRPPSHFRRAELGETHSLMSRLIPALQPGLGEAWLPDYHLPESTPFTREKKEAEGGWEKREDRPALVVSSTSWTADEDFGLLLRAARLYEYRARVLNDQKAGVGGHSRSSTGENISSSLSPSSTSHFSYPPSPTYEVGVRTSKERRRPSSGLVPSTPHLPDYPATTLPRLLIIVTGKGELRARYLSEIAHLEQTEKWQFVRIRTAWLESSDYPLLLGSAELGVSLHTSSSGLDLPMKVVDMLGCGLPVCALDFACLDELVRERSNGVAFRDAEGLVKVWESLLGRWPERDWLRDGGGLECPFDPPTSNSTPRTGLLEVTRAAGGGGGGVGGVPMSPNPSMTLLHSPEPAPSTNGFFEAGKSQRSRRSTWSGNWKHVMRPLLDPRTTTDDQEEGKRDSYLNPTRSRSSALEFPGLANGGRLLQRRTKGYAPLPSKYVVRKDTLEDDDVDESPASAGFKFIPQPALISEGESQKGLRQRKSVSKTAPTTGDDLIDLNNSTEAPFYLGSSAAKEGLPAIQVSHTSP